MCIDYWWDDSDGGHICRMRFHGHWTWDEFVRVTEQLHDEGRQLNERYDVIADFLESPRLPPGSSITHAYNVFRRLPPNIGLNVVITRSAFVRAMTEILAKVHPETRRYFAVVSTLEQAQEVIAQARAEAARRE
ncbi:MAG: hypothetical protein ACUVSX_13425 [Aggregatilineales bacterium]